MERPDATAFWRFCVPQVVSDSFQMGIQWLDILILGALASPHETGVYAAIGRFPMVGLLGLVAVAQVVAPPIAALLAKHDLDGVEDIFRKTTIWVCAFSVPFYIVVAVFPHTCAALFGSQFGSGAVPLSILSVATIADVAAGPVMVILLMGGRSTLGMLDTGVALLANVLLNVALIPMFGITGAAIAWAVSIVISNGMPLLQVRALWHISPFCRDYWVVLGVAGISFGGCSAVTRILATDSLEMLAVASTVAIVVYLALLRLLGVRMGWSPFRGQVVGGAEFGG